MRLSLACICNRKHLIRQQGDAGRPFDRPSSTSRLLVRPLFLQLPSFRVTHVRVHAHTLINSQSLSQPLTQQVPIALKHETHDDDDDRDLLYLRPNCLAL